MSPVVLAVGIALIVAPILAGAGLAVGARWLGREGAPDTAEQDPAGDAPTVDMAALIDICGLWADGPAAPTGWHDDLPMSVSSRIGETAALEMLWHASEWPLPIVPGREDGGDQ